MLDTYLILFITHPPTPHIYTLSLHDALPISRARSEREPPQPPAPPSTASPPPACATAAATRSRASRARGGRSEEHTSELQSQSNLVCRLLLEKKKKKTKYANNHAITNQEYDA